MRGDLFDLHAAFAAGDQRHALPAAVDHHADVIFLGDVRAFFDQQAPDFLPRGAGLVRHQLHAQYLARVLTHLVQRLRDLDAAALAATAGMNLRLHYPYRAAQFARSGILLRPR